jgi:hypothetical protein
MPGTPIRHRRGRRLNATGHGRGNRQARSWPRPVQAGPRVVGPTIWSRLAGRVGCGDDVLQTMAAARTPLAVVGHRLDHHPTAPLVAARPWPSQGLLLCRRRLARRYAQRINAQMMSPFGTVASRSNSSGGQRRRHDRTSSAAHDVTSRSTTSRHRRSAPTPSATETATATNARGVWVKSSRGSSSAKRLRRWMQDTACRGSTRVFRRSSMWVTVACRAAGGGSVVGVGRGNGSPT